MPCYRSDPNNKFFNIPHSTYAQTYNEVVLAPTRDENIAATIHLVWLMVMGLDQRMNKLDAESKKIDARLDEHDTRLTRLKADSKKMDDQLDKLEADSNKMDERLDKLKADSKKIDDRLDKLEVENKEIAADINDLKLSMDRNNVHDQEMKDVMDQAEKIVEEAERAHENGVEEQQEIVNVNEKFDPKVGLGLTDEEINADPILQELLQVVEQGLEELNGRVLDPKVEERYRQMEEFENAQNQFKERLEQAQQAQTPDEKVKHKNLMKDIRLDHQKKKLESKQKVLKEEFEEAKQAQKPEEKAHHNNLMKEIKLEREKKQLKKRFEQAQEAQTPNDIILRENLMKQIVEKNAEKIEPQQQIQETPKEVIELKKEEILEQSEAEKQEKLKQVVQEHLIQNKLSEDKSRIQEEKQVIQIQKVEPSTPSKTKNVKETQHILKIISNLFFHLFTQVFLKWNAELVAYTWKKIQLPAEKNNPVV